ncbi:MAG: hypothetical protein C3F13_05240 [Anaerolineales bacterium]|nr:DUF2029 domain-containing protein [Anaerolineae bacterium]PWB55126.1 MAG: hypothetical protein C3F13_05240 [Anaerolineales bacterium]
MNKSRTPVSILIVLLCVVLLLGVVWANYRFAQYRLFGEGFSIQWLGIHALVSEGANPYSELITTRIQDAVKSVYGFSPGVAPKYTSPLYSAIITFPFALINSQATAHSVWFAIQLVVVFAILLLCIKLTAWKPAWYILLLFTIFTIFSYHVVMPWLDGSLSIWSALFLVSALLAISQNRDEVAGILLGLSAFQPQMVILPIIFTLIWAGAHKRRLLILWFFILLILLSIIGMFLVPDWIIQYLRLLFNYSENFPPGTPGFLFQDLWPGIGRQLGWVISGVLLVILAFEWWLARRREFRWFTWTICLTIVISQWIGIPTIPANFIVLLIPLVFVTAMLAERWPRGGNWVATISCMLLFVWEWGLFYLDITGSQPAMQLNLLIPLPLLLLIGLYWVRWWAIKPRKLLVEELKFSESY